MSMIKRYDLRYYDSRYMDSDFRKRGPFAGETVCYTEQTKQLVKDLARNTWIIIGIAGVISFVCWLAR